MAKQKIDLWEGQKDPFFILGESVDILNKKLEAMESHSRNIAETLGKMSTEATKKSVSV